MATAKPTLILIHGGWHIPKSYSKLTDALESAGYDIYVPALPSMNGARPPTANLATDTEYIRSYVESFLNDGKIVVVLMHSYGGQVGSNALYGLGFQDRAMKSLPGGVARLIYITAFAMPEGKSMMDKVQEFGHMDLIPLAFDFADDDTCVNRDPKMLLIGPGVENEEAEAYVSTLVRWNGKTMYEPLSHCAWKEIPVTYIYTTQDMTVPFDYQKSMVQNLQSVGREVQTIELETGHCPNLTMTKEVVDAIENSVTGV